MQVDLYLSPKKICCTCKLIYTFRPKKYNAQYFLNFEITKIVSYHIPVICSACRKYHKSAVDRSPWVSEQSEDTDAMNKPYPSRYEMNMSH